MFAGGLERKTQHMWKRKAKMFLKSQYKVVTLVE